nr:reverse transcriptase domain-containing protein [Tanacetum cinerariifolium]
MERFKVETGRMKGAPECMRIFGFMHGVNNSELTKRLNEHFPKTIEEMMITTTAFIRGETVAASKKKGHASWRAQDQSKRQTSEKRTPKEILAAEAGKFQSSSPMVTPVEKRSNNKFCDFHNDKGHSTDECIQLKKQIEELVRAGMLGFHLRDDIDGITICIIVSYTRVSLEIILINLDTSSDNSSSNSGNNTSDSFSTSQISTSEEIDYDSLDYKGSRKSLLKWYGYLSDEYKDKGGNESDAKPSFSDILKAKVYMLAKAQASDASSKAKVQVYGSKAKLQRSPKTLIVKSHVPITNDVLGLANAETWDVILSKTFGVKIAPTMTCAEEKKGKRKIKIIILSSDSSDDDKKGPSKASVPIFKGPSVQGLLDYYGYNDIKEYLSWNYFPSTDKENTDKDITDKDTTDEDCIHEFNYAMSKACICRLLTHLLAHAATKLTHLLALAACSLHLHLAIAACICRLLTHLLALAATKLTHLLPLAACKCSLQIAFASSNCNLHLQVAYSFACTCSNQTYPFA